MRGNHLLSLLCRPAGPALALWLGLACAQSQWVAYNDHYRGPNTGSKVSAWTFFTTVGGAPVGGPPGNSGLLTNSVSGVAVPVTMTVTNIEGVATSVGIAAGGPNEGTPAALAFTNYIDFAIGVTTNVIQLATSSRIAHIFSGCDPTRRYSWRGTAARANNYTDRWTLVEVVAAAATPAHASTPVALRTYFTTADIGALTALQVICNFGENRAAGMLAGWDDIQPNPDGTIVVYSSTWRGAMPAGYSSAGTYGYAVIADRLEEFVIGPPSAPTNQNVNLPADASADGCTTVTLTSTFIGTPSPSYLWFKDGVAMDTVANPTAATPTLVLTNIQPAAAGSYYIRASNASGDAVSREATVAVTIQPPQLLSVVAQGTNANSFLFTFNVPVDASTFDYFSIQFVSRNGVPATLGEYATSTAQAGPTTALVTSQFPREAGINYRVIVGPDSALTDVCSQTVLSGTNMDVFTEILLADKDNAADLWSYNQSGANQGTAWKETDYNDSAWLTGPSFFGLETAASVLGTIRTPWTLSAAQLTYYLRKSANVPAPSSQIASLTLTYQADDGCVTYMNGREVDRFGFAPGVTVTSTSLSAQYASEPVPLFTIPLAVTNVVEGRNVIAVEVHQTSTTSTDVLYGSTVAAVCRTIFPSVLIAQSGNTVTASWPEYGVDGRLQTSTDLVNWVTDGRTPSYSGGNYSLDYTVPAGSAQLFMRLRP